MIYTCLPSGNSHGWGIAGGHIRRELDKICEHRDVSGISVATVLDAPLLMAVAGADGAPMNPNLQTTRNYAGYGFCESPDIAASFLDNWNAYDVVVCGSSWMRDRMAEIGVRNVAVALQGVDYEIFKPAPERTVGFPFKGSPFVVFVGGKAELRKGTDIAIAVMAEFMRKNQDARMIAAIANFWPSCLHTLEKSSYIRYERVSDDWAEQMTSVFLANDIPISRVLMPNVIDNSLMNELFYSSHVGIFCNRVEAGTNLVLCECIASGLPVLATQTTGHADIVKPCKQAGFEFDDGDPVGGIVASLEDIQKRYAYYQEQGRKGAALIRQLISWPKCARQLLDILEG